jgi:hypothetical protein
MSEFVWRTVNPERLAPGDDLTHERIGNFVLSRAIMGALVEVAADKSFPFELVARVGEDEVVWVAFHVRRESSKESPS